MWRYNGSVRPDFAEPVGPGQESVWDYPRPPVIREDSRNIRVTIADELVADSQACLRILETAGAPTFYIPPEDVQIDLLEILEQRSFCEWKGTATYCRFVKESRNDSRSIACGWQYTNPSPAYASIQNYFSFYPAIADCFVNGEKVTPQPGGFYGGWVTSEIVGPIKGTPGTEGW
ncbi:MAG: DUF427 domain-containing protein [Pseudomonadota bacterium]